MNRQELIASISLAGILFVRLFSIFVLLPIFSLYATELKGATPFLVGFAFGGYALTQFLFQIPFGWLSDIYSRKIMLILGLLLFASGAFISAYSSSISWMIIGRFLQGAGAISAVVYATIGDLIRPQFQIRAIALIGIGAGLAFLLAFSLSPFLAIWLGLSGIFSTLGVLSLGLALVVFFSPIFTLQQKAKASLKLDLFFKRELVLPLSLFLAINFALSVFMFQLPLQIVASGVAKASLWKFYIPLLSLSLISIYLASYLAEKAKKLKLVLFMATSLMLIGASSALGLNQSPSYLIIGCFIYFIGFSALEPILPALTLRAAATDSRGISSSLLTTTQFAGNFLGALSAGYFYQRLSLSPFIIIIIGSLLLIRLILKQDK